MIPKLSYRIVGLLLVFFSVFQGTAQFYNGHRMTFGKNRVQYTDFFWQQYDFDDYTTWFYNQGEKTARYVGLRTQQIKTELEYRLDHSLTSRINLIVYNDLLDFRQSNIGMVTGNDDYNIGGITTISNNKVLIYNYGDHLHIDYQIRKAIAQLLINDVLVGNKFSDRMTESALLSYPEWFTDGLIEYYASEFDVEKQNKIKDGFLNGKLDRIQWLTGEEARLAGLSFWTYIAMNFGEQSLRDIAYFTRLSKNVKTGFLFVTGIKFRHLLAEWKEYMLYRYKEENKYFEDDASKRIRRTKRNVLYKNITISPDGKYVAWSTNHEGKAKIFIQDLATGKRKTVCRYGHRLPQIPDTKYPIVRWHPSNMLTWVYEDDNIIHLAFYSVQDKTTEERNIYQIQRILDYSFDNEGVKMAFTAVKDGKTDIFELDLPSNDQLQISNDLADNIQPHYTTNGTIVFSSNRDPINQDTLQNHFDLYTTTAGKFEPKELVVEEGNQTNPVSVSNNRYVFLSDQNGINNFQKAKADSAILFIDTAIHYRHFTNTGFLSNYKMGITSFDYLPSKGLLKNIKYSDRKYNLLSTDLDLDTTTPEPLKTEQKAYFDARRTYYDQLMPRLARENQQNDSLININNYTFDFEKKTKETRWPQFDQDKVWLAKRRYYLTTFYTNYLVNQVDFSQLNQSYQVYTGGAVFFNPGFNVLTKFGAADLFENYKVTAGLRIAANLTGNEYLISIENNKKRLDKQLIMHRMGAEEYNEEEYIRSYTNQVLLVYKYPFSQVSSVRLTTRLRLDQITYPSVDLESLGRPDEFRFWGGALAEYVYDNTKSLGLNLLSGTRGKVFFEEYSRLQQNMNQHMFVFGADFRHYLQIHRQLIWANRLATSTSFGNALLIYYLGGVDNWMSFTNNGYFDQTIPVDKDKNWAFQTVATNMRGFQQNVRNGNSFAVLNSELRWPVIKYIFNRPLNSDILDNFMLMGFCDVGSAWYGFDPTNTDNFYRYDYVENGPVFIRIDKQRDPIVAGYGFGMRTRIFGYYIRLDWAWGVENKQVLDRMFYFSINLDF